jgi:hypothetical protein
MVRNDTGRERILGKAGPFWRRQRNTRYRIRRSFSFASFPLLRLINLVHDDNLNSPA